MFVSNLLDVISCPKIDLSFDYIERLHASHMLVNYNLKCKISKRECTMFNDLV